MGVQQEKFLFPSFFSILQPLPCQYRAVIGETVRLYCFDNFEDLLHINIYIYININICLPLLYEIYFLVQSLNPVYVISILDYFLSKHSQVIALNEAYEIRIRRIGVLSTLSIEKRKLCGVKKFGYACEKGHIKIHITSLVFI